MSVVSQRGARVCNVLKSNAHALVYISVISLRDPRVPYNFFKADVCLSVLTIGERDGIKKEKEREKNENLNGITFFQANVGTIYRYIKYIYILYAEKRETIRG